MKTTRLRGAGVRPKRARGPSRLRKGTGQARITLPGRGGQVEFIDEELRQKAGSGEAGFKTWDETRVWTPGQPDRSWKRTRTWFGNLGRRLWRGRK